MLIPCHDCDLIVKGDLISRYHSKIEHRRGKFIITDQSTNGTFIKTSGGQIIFLRREEFTLFGSGFISLGRKVNLADDNIIHLFKEAAMEVDNKELGDITVDTEIATLGLDSVMTMEVIGVLEEKLDARFPDEDLATLRRVGDLTALVRKVAA